MLHTDHLISEMAKCHLDRQDLSFSLRKRLHRLACAWSTVLSPSKPRASRITAGQLAACCSPSLSHTVALHNGSSPYITASCNGSLPQMVRTNFRSETSRDLLVPIESIDAGHLLAGH